MLFHFIIIYLYILTQPNTSDDLIILKMMHFIRMYILYIHVYGILIHSKMGFMGFFFGGDYYETTKLVLNRSNVNQSMNQTNININYYKD